MNKKIVVISSLVLLLDQVVKSIIEINKVHLTLIDNVLKLNYFENTGAAFSIMQDKTTLLILISLVMLVIIYSMAFSYDESKLTNIAFGLLFGGVFGNLIDRVFCGFVRDFIDISFLGMHFPVFNIADMGIVIGALLLVIATIKGENKDGNKSTRGRRKLKNR